MCWSTAKAPRGSIGLSSRATSKRYSNLFLNDLPCAEFIPGCLAGVGSCRGGDRTALPEDLSAPCARQLCRVVAARARRKLFAFALGTAPEDHFNPACSNDRAVDRSVRRPAADGGSQWQNAADCDRPRHIAHHERAYG